MCIEIMNRNRRKLASHKHKSTDRRKVLNKSANSSITRPNEDISRSGLSADTVSKGHINIWTEEKEKEQEALKKSIRENYVLKKRFIEKAEENFKLFKINQQIEKISSNCLNDGKNYKETLINIQKIINS